VTAEVFRPGCVIEIDMDYVPGNPTTHGEVFGDGVTAVCSWDPWPFCKELYASCAAGREGELLAGGDEERHDHGDRERLREWASPRERRVAHQTAKALVRRHELAVRRVAKALAERRVMTGTEIREVIAAQAERTP
jgi:hypothetical protein